jgi:hypothetical protein
LYFFSASHGREAFGLFQGRTSLHAATFVVSSSVKEAIVEPISIEASLSRLRLILTSTEPAGESAAEAHRLVFVGEAALLRKAADMLVGPRLPASSGPSSLAVVECGNPTSAIGVSVAPFSSSSSSSAHSAFVSALNNGEKVERSGSAELSMPSDDCAKDDMDGTSILIDSFLSSLGELSALDHVMDAAEAISATTARRRTPA